MKKMRQSAACGSSCGTVPSLKWDIALQASVYSFDKLHFCKLSVVPASCQI